MSHDFKIGEKVCRKDSNEFLGYVSHVFKGHLFLLDEFEIHVHIGNGERVVVGANELKLFEEK